MDKLLSKNTILLSILILGNCGLSAQEVIDSAVFKIKKEIDWKDLSCEEVDENFQYLKNIQEKVLGKMQQKADSLNQLQYPCYHFSTQFFGRKKIPYNTDTDYKCPGKLSRIYYHWRSYTTFVVYLQKKRRLNIFTPMYSGEVFCDETDFYRRQ